MLLRIEFTKHAAEYNSSYNEFASLNFANSFTKSIDNYDNI